MIYFDKGGFIWSVRPDGTELRKVSRGIDAHISPDGKRVYCKCAPHGGIGVMKPDGSGLKGVGAGHEAITGSYLDLSGVGTFVTAESTDAISFGKDSAQSEAEVHAIYTAPAEHDAGGYHWEKIGVDLPFISPDGKSVAFYEYEEGRLLGCVSYNGGPVDPCPHPRPVRINVVNSDGSGLHTVLEQPLPTGLAGFSGDGRKVLIYTASLGSGKTIGTGATVAIANANGGLERELVLPRNGDGPLLSEHGERIAFSSIAVGSCCTTRGIFTVGDDGAGLKQVAPAGRDEHVTSWGKVVVPVTKPH